jgi:hypothetical protein
LIHADEKYFRKKKENSFEMTDPLFVLLSSVFFLSIKPNSLVQWNVYSVLQIKVLTNSRIKNNDNEDL